MYWATRRICITLTHLTRHGRVEDDSLYLSGMQPPWFRGRVGAQGGCTLDYIFIFGPDHKNIKHC